MALPALGSMPLSFEHGRDGLPGPNKASWGRFLLPTSSEAHTSHTEAIAFLDGTIYLLDTTSGTTYGSFSSGSQLSASYQFFDTVESDRKLVETEDFCSQNSDHYFISPGDDGNLYEHSNQFGKRKLNMTIEEFAESTPRMSKDGGITLSSKKSTTFIVDLMNGTIISSQWSAGDPPFADSQGRQDQLALFYHYTPAWAQSNPGAISPVLITRTDYSINHSLNSGKPQWGMTISVIEAASCQVCEDDLSLPFGPGLGSNYDGIIKQRNKITVHRAHGIDPLKNELVSSTRISLPKTPTLAASPVDIQLTEQFSVSHVMGQLSDSNRALNALLEGPPSTCTAGKRHKRSYSGGQSFFYNQAPPVRSDDLQKYHGLFLALLPLVLLNYVNVKYHSKNDKWTSKPDMQTASATKKKRTRTSEICNGSIPTEKDEDNNKLMNFSKVDEKSEGKQIGRLFLSNNQITKGSNGAVILEGVIEGRPVAVKRLIHAHHDVAFKEIKNLIASDHHFNIARWFGVEKDLDFIYIALERCICSLNDLIFLYPDSSTPTSAHKIRKAECSPNLKQITEDVKLWKPDGCPTPQLLKIMRDVVSGVAHLHELGIVHGDINPQNILLTAKNKSLSAKLSGMGNSERLSQDMPSLGNLTTGSGTSGWQAPEQLSHGYQTRAVDLFSLGCVLFFCITKGRHPFGNHYERDSNIVNNRVDLFLLNDIPEALHLFSTLLDCDPEKRPQAAEVLQHPLFWSSEMRLSFLKDASDRAELDRESNSELLRELESIGPIAFRGKWDKKCDASLLTDISRHRRYRYNSTCDLLRVIRNKLNHYMELPKALQELLGSNPDGLDQYFSARFPRLLMEVYKVMYMHCRDDESFRKYFKSTES